MYALFLSVSVMPLKCSQSRVTTAFPSHWPGSSLPVPGGEGCSSHQHTSSLLCRTKGFSLLWPDAALFAAEKTNQETGEKMDIHNLCVCSNKWEIPFLIPKPTKCWKKLWKLAPGNLYRLGPALKPLQVTHFPSNSFQMNQKGMISAEGNFQHSWWLYPKITIFWDTGQSLIKNQFSFQWSKLY